MLVCITRDKGTPLAPGSTQHEAAIEIPEHDTREPRDNVLTAPPLDMR